MGKAVPQSASAGSDAAETSPWGQQREQSVGRVAGVFDNPPGFPCTPPGVDILEGGKLTSNNVAGSSHDPLQSPAVASGAVSKPGGDTAGQDALHSAGVEGSEDSGARSKLPQPSQEEETLMCLLQHCICVSRPCEILGDVNAEELPNDPVYCALFLQILECIWKPLKSRSVKLSRWRTLSFYSLLKQSHPFRVLRKVGEWDQSKSFVSYIRADESLTGLFFFSIIYLL